MERKSESAVTGHVRGDVCYLLYRICARNSASPRIVFVEYRTLSMSKPPFENVFALLRNPSSFPI